MPPEDIVRLRHMLEAINDTNVFVQGRSRSELDSNKMLLFALVRCIEVLGEAAGRISEPTRTCFPAIPWAAMTGMRNRLVHAYFDIDTEIVWKTVTIELPALAGQLRTLLNQH